MPSHANLDSGLLPSNYAATEDSVVGESVGGHNTGGHLSQHLEEPSRVSSGTSVTTGPHTYVGEEPKTVAT